MKEYLAFWKNCINFSDRTSVRGYWVATLMHFIVYIAVFFILVTLAVILDYVSDSIPGILGGLYVYIGVIYLTVAIIPNLSLSVRRLHDINKSGWWLLISFIPLVGSIILLVWFCFGSVDKGNRYGTYKV